MAERKLCEKTKHICICEKSKQKLIEICKTNFCYQEIKIYVDKDLIPQNDFFSSLRKEKNNIFDVEFVRDLQNINIDEKVALVVAIGNETLCVQTQQFCETLQKNYCLIPIGFLNENIFLANNKPFAVLIDMQLSDFFNKNIIAEIYASIINKFFLICENKLEYIMCNKNFDYNLNKKIYCHVKEAKKICFELLNNNKEKKLHLIKLFIEMCLFLQKYNIKTCENQFKYSIEILAKLQIYLEFFLNLNNWCDNPVKLQLHSQAEILNFKNNYENFDCIKTRYVALTNANYCIAVLKKTKVIIQNLIKFINIYDSSIYYCNNNKVEFALSNCLKDVDCNSHNSLLKIIRNFGFLNF